MTLDKIKALLAESDRTGRPIQVKVSDRWVTTRAHEDVTFQLPEDSYRVEPPKLREWWVFPDGVKTHQKNGQWVWNPVVPVEMCDRSPAIMRKIGYVLSREVTEDSK